MHLFDAAPLHLALYYSDEGLHFFQAAATWILSIGKNKIKLPVLQFRKVLNRKPYLFFYTLDEILAHEAVHSVRVAFDEPKTEEFFSYMTASNILRKIFGPIVRSAREVFVFFGLMFCYFIFQIFWIVFSITFFYKISLISALVTFSYIGLGLIRLFNVRRKCANTFTK
ncbi:MAG: hypothetical protein ACD_7C00363G0001, partial [uncultured bacterium]